MSSNDRPHLKLVPFNPNDYNLGAALAPAHSTILNDDRLMSAALSLYFQWESYRSAFVCLFPGTEKINFKCELDYDRDERFPTELYLSIDSKANLPQSAVRNLDALSIMFEVFGVCYQFNTHITSILGERKYVLSMPIELTVLKARKLPRYDLSDLPIDSLPVLEWTSLSGNEVALVQINELGLKSVAGRPNSLIKENKGTFKLNDLKIKAEVVRVSNSQYVFALIFENGFETGVFFNFYRKYAYPELRRRFDLPLEEGFELYKKTGYFSKFSSDENEKKKACLVETWDTIRTGEHHTTADYYVVDESEQITGCSSVVLAFFDGQIPVWAFHQLCSIKQPYLLLNSGQLYKWRAEYLAARPENLTVAVWFDGNSRWLERIYVKFSIQTSGDTKLYPVVGRKCTFNSDESSSQVALSIHIIEIGVAKRFLTKAENIWCGHNPPFLNAAGNLNGIVDLWQFKDLNKIKQIGSNLAAESKMSEVCVKVTVPHGVDLEPLGGELQLENRFIHISKDDLTSFASSVMHSVAVMERKLREK